MDQADLAEIKHIEEMSVTELSNPQEDVSVLARLLATIDCTLDGQGPLEASSYDHWKKIPERVQALKDKITKLRKQNIDGWIHPEEIIEKQNRLEQKILRLRKSLGSILSIALENAMDWVDEDPTGARLEMIRPQLQEIVDKLNK
jgi:hypothetical protein